MKRIICLLAVLLLNINALAGSLPEDLVGEDYAQVFFAKLVSYSPDAEGESAAELIPTKVIKGDVKIGDRVFYAEPMKCGDFTVKMGEEYLFCYFDKSNPTYFFKTTANDPKTLKFVGTTGNMWLRLQEYLNEGRFDKAEQIQSENGELPETVEREIGENLPSSGEIILFLGGGAIIVLLLACGIVYLIKQKGYRRNDT